MAGVMRCWLKARDHARSIILLMMFENVFTHHSSGTTVPDTKTTLEQDPQMLQMDMIVGPIARQFDVPTERTGMLAPVDWQFSWQGNPNVCRQT